MKNVLVVEDDRATRELLCVVLDVKGVSVVGARDGVDALEKLGKKQFDLVVTDIWMPRMNGLELLAQLRSRPRKPRVVVMTSDNTPETLLRAVREQAYQYLTKPVDPQALLKLARGALAASPASPPIQVLSASPEWVELLAPCDLATADRIESFMARLKADLPPEARYAMGRIFHEMLRNAIEWGGQMDPNRKVRIACLRTKRMILFRIADPGSGFSFEELNHAAVSYPPYQVLAHVPARQRKGIRPGGFGILKSRAMAQELIYNEPHNEVVFVEYLEDNPETDLRPG